MQRIRGQHQTQYYLIPIMSYAIRAIVIKYTQTHTHGEREKTQISWKTYIQEVFDCVAAVTQFLFVYLMVIRFSSSAKQHLYLKPISIAVAAQTTT